jgi:type III pantothenate kinase
MVLTIDAGNTNIAIGIFDGQELAHHWRLSSRTQRTADEFALHLRELFAGVSLESGLISSAVVSSVVPELTSAIVDGVDAILPIRPLLVEAGVELPVRIITENPAEVGSDLIANAVGGFAHFRQACIVVDFGTALTFTAVDGEANVRGVAIAPGLRTAVHGLVSRTSALPMVELSPPESFIGTNTIASLRSGIINGYAGLVRHMVAGMKRELGAEDGRDSSVAVAMTGGEAGVIAPLTGDELEVLPWLTLQGLYHIGAGTSFR